MKLILFLGSLALGLLGLALFLTALTDPLAVPAVGPVGVVYMVAGFAGAGYLALPPRAK